jgi:hypothetical protein
LSRDRSSLAFDLYLLLLKASKGENGFSIAYDAVSREMGFTDYSNPRNEILWRLKRLDKLGVLRFQALPRAADIRIVLTPLEGDAVDIPAAYWDFGWSRRLTMAGKISYLVNKLRSERSPMRPRWSAALDTMVRDHGISKAVFVKGTSELRRANLLEVEYDELTMTGGDRRPNIYTPRSLYDPAVLDKAWADLERRFGGEKLARARRCADLVYEDSDAATVERFIQLEEAHGREKVEEAYKLISLKHPANPRRTAAYFIATIQNLQ